MWKEEGGRREKEGGGGGAEKGGKGEEAGCKEEATGGAGECPSQEESPATSEEPESCRCGSRNTISAGSQQDKNSCDPISHP